MVSLRCSVVVAALEWKIKDLPEEKQDEEFNKLHKQYAPTVEELTLRLKGAIAACSAA